MAAASASDRTSKADFRKQRSSTERLVVWGLIFVLAGFVGLELYAQQSFQRGLNALHDRLEKSESDSKAKASLTDQDVRKILGKEPEFSGNPGQILANSQYYEAFVWRSLLKRDFVPPPEQPEMLDLHAILSGTYPYEKVKYRTPGLDKNRETPLGFSSAYTIYVYYGTKDLKTGIREVVNVSDHREPYFDDVQKLPDAAELKKRHDLNLAIAIGNASKFRKTPLTDDEKERLDPWKFPPGTPSPVSSAPQQDASKPAESSTSAEKPKKER